MEEKTSNEPQSEENTSYQAFTGRKKLFIIGLTIVIIIALALGLYLYFRREKSTVNETGGAINIKTNSTNNYSFYAAPVIVEEESNDDDRDGLTNSEEEKLGTDPKKADSDDDNLGDYDEVKIYQTDPKIKDTDGDGYLDGDEVKEGYNPKGSGKLLDVSRMINNTNK